METSLFDYPLPPDRIAQKSMEPREAAKLLVLGRKTGAVDDKKVGDLPTLLRKGDLLIFNDSKVFKARLKAVIYGMHTREAGKEVEIFLLRPDGDVWIAMARPGKKLHTGCRVMFEDGSKARVLGKREDGTIDIDFGIHPDRVFELADQYGIVPVPPYVEPTSENTSAYQTAYAKHVGSVAAPTAGFHFTNALLDELKNNGIEQAFVTLHVGLGTFRPMKSETLGEHVMHEEWAHVPKETILMVQKAKQEGRRVIVVGTTAMRAVESWAEKSKNQEEWSGFTNLFITPGFEFKVADGLITNFHLPKSTLIVLVSSFAGREQVMNAYKHAIENDYRFYSFGDAMLIV
ncbi:tRNA preQ1(34) S-adenosylmethionine ribosyltransferase-isomerase QueA [Candidatus Uhrbacteria bacterium]|nr:tRNA preQ1(34) S-adenosylmethionine ribosyltransferase-isomerase QueA [Candidatus Uhrbacteria bacterium]